MQPGNQPLLEVRRVSVAFGAGAQRVVAVEDASFTMQAGERVALVGASGSGKTTLALAIPRLLPPAPSCTVTGEVRLAGRNLDGERELRAARGREIGVVYQDPLAALNPLMRAVDQVAEAILAHDVVERSAARAQALRWLARVGLDERAGGCFPFELSGGMRQRVVIAMAVACRPALLILDEPTTSLDSVTQAHVLELLDELRAELAFAVLLVTHDLALARGRCERAIVMAGGRIRDDGPIEAVLARTNPGRANARTPSPVAAPDDLPLLSVRALSAAYRTRSSRGPARDRRVLDDVSFDLSRGETLAVVGGSGAGKTTLARALLRLLEPTSGSVLYRREPDGPACDLVSLRRGELRAVRSDLGIVFQDPAASLDPRRTARHALHEALAARGSRAKRDAAHDSRSKAGDVERAAVRWMETVGLSAAQLERLPHQLSGGERQRVCLARALATEPRVLVLDEALSSLDGPIRDQMLDLLGRLARERGLACVLITHDLRSVERCADRVAVIHAGRIVEIGATRNVFAGPRAEATRALLAARARIGPAAVRPESS